jgi:transposase
MKYNQNFRIMQVTESTLIVGVDIAKKKHYARAFDWRGIELDKTISFKSRYQGFQDFIGWVNEVSSKYCKDKIILGLEPTGHYWYTFAQEILAQGHMIVQVNPYHVKKAKELDDNSPSKSDRKDPKTIAMLVKDCFWQV